MPQSEAKWVKDCEADFHKNGFARPLVHEYNGQETSVTQFRTIYEYWAGFARIDGVPVIDKIDPCKIKRALGDVLLIEPIDGNSDFRYRLYGTTMASRLGTDLTGTKLSELDAAPCVRRFIIRSYQATVEARQALLTMHILPEYVSTSNWRRLILPVANPAGEVYMMLVCNLAGKWRPVSPETRFSSRKLN